ncbi:protein of unknown function [Burkholderia multivorans]
MVNGGSVRGDALLAHDPVDQAFRILCGKRPAALGGARHRRVAPVRAAAPAQFVFEHQVRVRRVAVAFGDLMKRRREERRVWRMTEHAVLLVDQFGRLGDLFGGGVARDAGQRGHGDEQGSFQRMVHGARPLTRWVRPV